MYSWVNVLKNELNYLNSCVRLLFKFSYQHIYCINKWFFCCWNLHLLKHVCILFNSLDAFCWKKRPNFANHERFMHYMYSHDKRVVHRRTPYLWRLCRSRKLVYFLLLGATWEHYWYFCHSSDGPPVGQSISLRLRDLQTFICIDFRKLIRKFWNRFYLLPE